MLSCSCPRICKFALAVAVSSLAGCYDFNALTEGYKDLGLKDLNRDGPADTPATCEKFVDGTQLLYINFDRSKPWTAKCAGGKTYLLLTRTGVGENYSQYKAGGFSPGADVTTRYAAVHFDPDKLLVDVSDQKFATSSGSLQGPGGTVTSMPYGVAMDCINKTTAMGKANIDLHDTSFAIAPDALVVGGFQMASMFTVSLDERAAVLSGGGECGWASAGNHSGAPVNTAGGFQFQLQYKP